MPRGQYPRQARQAVAQKAPPVPVLVAEPECTDPLQPNRRVEDMQEDELRTYALQIGLSRSDAHNLAVGRLRECCLHRLYEVIEDL